jgi:hypothetical protein
MPRPERMDRCSVIGAANHAEEVIVLGTGGPNIHMWKQGWNW